MDVNDVDPLAVQPVTASASAAFAPAADFIRERQEQFRSLRTTLASGERSTVVRRDAIGTDQALCMSRVAVMRDITCAASRPARAVLGDVPGQSCVIRPPVPPLVQGRPRGG